MAVVMTRKYGNAIVRVHDDAYRDCTPEEMQQRRREFDQCVYEILSQPGAVERLEEMYRKRAEEAAVRAGG